MVNFNATKEEYIIIRACIRRAMREGIVPRRDKVERELDLEAVHCNDTPLDLQKLLDFPEFDFAHDILGIRRHLNRDTGKLMDCFLPRCARPSKKGARHV